MVRLKYNHNASTKNMQKVVLGGLTLNFLGVYRGKKQWLLFFFAKKLTGFAPLKP